MNLSPIFASTVFNGWLDEARVVTFTPGESAVNVINALQAVPEPSSRVTI